MMTQLLKALSLINLFIFVLLFNPKSIFAQEKISVAELISLTNLARQNQSLSSLRLNPLLTQAAQTKALSMLQDGYFSHLNLSDQPPWIYLEQVGYDYSAAGENLARDYATSQAVIDAWLNSPSHRDNLLGPQYQDIGMAVVSGVTPQNKPTTIVVQLLATPTHYDSLSNATSSSRFLTADILSPTPLPLPMLFLLFPIILAALWFSFSKKNKPTSLKKTRRRHQTRRFHPPPDLWQD